MVHELSFPKLGIALKLSRVAFSVFGVEVYWYGIIVMCAMAAAVIYALVRAREFKISPDLLMTVIVWAIFGGVIGARAYYVAFNHQNMHSLWDVLNIRSGGIAIYGGLLGGGVGLVASARAKKLKILPLLDLAVGSVALGQAVGRWGNFVNMEAFGCNTSLAWGMTSIPIQRILAALKASGVKVSPDLPVHPCFLYESLWCLTGFVFIVAYTRRRRFDGELFLFYLAWYSFGRFFIEGLRIDSLMWGSFRVSQLLSGVLFLAAVVLFWQQSRKLKARQKP